MCVCGRSVKDTALIAENSLYWVYTPVRVPVDQRGGWRNSRRSRDQTRPQSLPGRLLQALLEGFPFIVIVNRTTRQYSFKMWTVPKKVFIWSFLFFCTYSTQSQFWIYAVAVIIWLFFFRIKSIANKYDYGTVNDMIDFFSQMHILPVCVRARVSVGWLVEDDIWGVAVSRRDKPVRLVSVLLLFFCLALCLCLPPPQQVK